MCSIDLQDAYHVIPIELKHRKYLRFVFEDKLFQYTCVPFGLATAPRLFTKLLRPVAAKLRGDGYTSNFYLDDILLIERDHDKCVRSRDITVQLLCSLGFLINMDKCQLEPINRIEYLGFVFDSIEMLVRLPDRKREKIYKLTNDQLGLEFSCIQDIAVLVGSYVSASPAVKYGILYTRNLEHEKSKALKCSNNDFSAGMTLSQKAKSELIWWKENIWKSFNEIRNDRYDICITTDSSLSGWGAHVGSTVTRGFWSYSERQLHISTLELIAVYNGLSSLLNGCKDKQILVRVDNTTALAYINRYGGCRSMGNHEWAKVIWKWCEARNNFIFASYISSKENVIADRASRENLDEYDYELDKKTFTRICMELGTPLIDLFASRHTNKCQRFVSWFPDVGSEAVDAFTIDWSNNFYAFPPVSLLNRVINKILNDKVEGIVVAPYWPSQAWFPRFLDMTRSQILYIQPGEYELTYPFDKSLNVLCRSTRLMVARLSGRECLKKFVTS